MTAATSAPARWHAILGRSDVRAILSMTFVAVGGFLLFNAAFIFIWLVSLAQNTLFPRLVRGPPALTAGVAIIWIASWFILRSNLRPLYKATFATMPLAWLYVVIGIALYPWPILAYSVGAGATLAVLAYLWRTKRPWIYSYTVILVSVTLAAFTALGGEI